MWAGAANSFLPTTAEAPAASMAGGEASSSLHQYWSMCAPPMGMAAAG